VFWGGQPRAGVPELFVREGFPPEPALQAGFPPEVTGVQATGFPVEEGARCGGSRASAAGGFPSAGDWRPRCSDSRRTVR